MKERERGRERFLPLLFSFNESIAKICIQTHLSICAAAHLAIILQENCHGLGVTQRSGKHLKAWKKRDIPASYQLP